MSRIATTLFRGCAVVVLFCCACCRGAEIEFQLELSDGWNLVCIPVEPVDSSVTGVFGRSILGPAWRWGGDAYEEAGVIEPWVGYWVNCPGGALLSIPGTSSASSVEVLDVGWNLTGPLFVLSARNAAVGAAWLWNAPERSYEKTSLPGSDASQAVWLYLTSSGAVEYRTFALSGSVAGDVPEAVAVALSGSAAVDYQTGNRGSYLFSDLPAGMYRVTLSAADTLFDPPSLPGVAITDGAVTGADFTALGLAADTSFLAQDVPGTYTFDQGSFAVQSGIYVLPESSGAVVNEAENTVTLPGTEWTYGVGDVLIGDSVLRFAKRITAVSTVAGATVLEVTDAHVGRILAEGATFGFTATPDWSSGGGGRGCRSLDEAAMSAGGVLDLDGVSLVDLAVGVDGGVDWGSSTIVGDAVDELALQESVLQADLAPGQLTVNITGGSLELVPTVTLTYDWPARGELDVQGRVDMHIVVDLDVTFSVPGATTAELTGMLLPELSVPATIPTDPPIYLDMGLQVPVTVRISADGAGTLDVSQRSEFTVSADLDYSPGGGITVRPTTDRTYSKTSIAPPVGQSLTGEVVLSPEITVQVYRQTACRLSLRSYLRGVARSPEELNADDLFSGVDLRAALELGEDGLFGAGVDASGLLLSVHRREDLIGPQDAGSPNTVPRAYTVFATVSAQSSEQHDIQLRASDADGDPLYFRVVSHPVEGSLVGLDPTTGRVGYVPKDGFIGTDSFTYVAGDGLAESAPATARVSVATGNAPAARFTVATDGLTAAFDAATSSDLQDDVSALEVRWDYDADGTWDTEWSTTKTAQHIYTDTGTVVAVCAVRDSAGMVDTARRVLTLTSAGTNSVPVPAFSAGTNLLVLSVDASASSDADDDDTSLNVRWDWHSDGVWDTDWSTTKTATHTYTSSGFYRVLLQVKDSDGNVSEADALAYVDASAGADSAYMVIDVSGGSRATTYPVWMYAVAPPDLLSNAAYRTSRIILRRVESGSFTMGSPEDEVGRYAEWETEHTVTLTEDFYVGVFEITQKQWELVMGTTPAFNVGNDGHPVEQVSWDAVRGGTWPGGDPGADTFMERLSARTSRDADLPTEARWEYACRAGTTTALNSSKDLASADSDDSMNEVGRYLYNGTSTAQVGGYLPNAWGLYDMHGNVWEWCLDGHVGDLGSDPVTDPVGPVEDSLRVARGGSWWDDAGSCRSASRDSRLPADVSADVGFRVVVEASTRR